MGTVMVIAPLVHFCCRFVSLNGSLFPALLDAASAHRALLPGQGGARGLQLGGVLPEIREK